MRGLTNAVFDQLELMMPRATGSKIKVHLRSTSVSEPSAGTWQRRGFDFLQRSATYSPLVTLCDDPAEAEVVIYTDSGPKPYCLSIIHDSVFRDYAPKCFVFNEEDKPIPLVRGFYCSLPSGWRAKGHAMSGFYLGVRAFAELGWPEAPRLLASFAGSCCNHPIRQRLKAYATDDILVDDLSGSILPAFTSGSGDEIDRLTEHFKSISRDSFFSLCPRGVGASSVRIFEVMQMGRCPVIISDEWSPPQGIAWEQFSLRIAEDDLPNLRAILLGHRHRARVMGVIARQVWEEAFSERSALNTILAWSKAAMVAGRPSLSGRLKLLTGFLQLYHLKHVTRLLRRRFLQTRVAGILLRFTSACRSARRQQARCG